MSITGVSIVDNSITGVENLFLDELDVNNVEANNIITTAVSSNTISLGGTDLQTTLTNLQTQINRTGGGGYFALCAEYAGNPVNQGRFSFGGSVNPNANLVRTTMPNCTLTAVRFELSSSLTTSGKTNIVVERNGVASTAGSGAFLTG